MSSPLDFNIGPPSISDPIELGILAAGALLAGFIVAKITNSNPLRPIFWAVIFSAAGAIFLPPDIAYVTIIKIAVIPFFGSLLFSVVFSMGGK
jgi:hypothetical protein